MRALSCLGKNSHLQQGSEILGAKVALAEPSMGYLLYELYFLQPPSCQIRQDFRRILFKKICFID